MTDDEFSIVAEQRAVQVHKHPPIRIVEIMPQILDALEEAQGEASQALGFFTALAGILVGVGAGWVAGATQFTNLQHLAFGGATAIALVGTLWFALVWLRRTRRRGKLLAQIRASVRVVSAGPPS